MTELKTLKDLPCATREEDTKDKAKTNYDEIIWVNHSTIKEQAKEWIKDIDKNGAKRFMVNDSFEDVLISFIKYFFNLTEEDLK